MNDDDISHFLHNRSHELAASVIIEAMRTIESQSEKLRQMLCDYSIEFEDTTPFKIQSILTSVAIVKLSKRLDEVAIKHVERVCKLIAEASDPTIYNRELLTDKLKKIPLISQFVGEINWIIRQFYSLTRFRSKFGEHRGGGFRFRLRGGSNPEFEAFLSRSMNDELKKKNSYKKFRKFMTEYTSSYPLLLIVAWVLYHSPNHNNVTTTEVQFDDFLHTLRSNGLLIGRQKAGGITVFSSRFYEKEKETIGLLNIPNSNQNMLSHFLPEHNPTYQKFDKLYSKYIRGLSNCLTFANCSSNLTRVNQLYHRPPKFYPDYVQQFRNMHNKQRDSFDTLAKLNQSISMQESKQYTQWRSTTKLNEYFSKGIRKHYHKNFPNKYKEIIQGLDDNPFLVGDIANSPTNGSPSLEDLEQSLKDLDAQSTPEDFTLDRAKIHHEIAKIHRSDGNYDDALENNISAIKFREKDEDYEGLSRSYNNLGLLELDFDKYSEAEEYFNKSIEIKREHKLSEDSIIITLKNLGSCYEKSRSFEEQESVLKRALNLSIETKNKKRHFQLSNLLHQFYEAHSNKDIYEEKSPYDGMLIEHPLYLDSNEILTSDLQRGHSFKPFVIQGSAGMGKTVVMTQIGLQYVTKIKRMLEHNGLGEMSFIPFPIFIKGRNVTHSEPINTYELESLILESNPDLLKYISSDELVDLLDIWKKYSHYHFGSFSLFIDAVDEMKNHETATDFLNFVIKHRSFRTSRRPLIFMSTRPSHTDILPSNCSFSLMRQNYYSKKELSVEMPKKLCDAWGITREITGVFKESFDSYEDILIHPLFVGWFCFLIQQGYNDELLLIESDKIDEEKEHMWSAESNYPYGFNSRLQYRKTTLLSAIINIGIEASLNRKQRTVESKEKFSSLVKQFVAISYHYSIYKPSVIFTIIEDNEGLVISEYDKKSLVDDCGILFLAGENIEWTHATIPEIIYAEYYYNLKDTTSFGPLKITDPILYKWASLTFDSGRNRSYEESVLWAFHTLSDDIKKLESYHQFSLISERLHDKLSSEIWIKIEEGELVNSVPQTRESMYWYHVIDIFLNKLGSKKEFKLPPEIKNAISDEAIKSINKLSNSPFGLIGTIHPDDLDLNKIKTETKMKEIFTYLNRVCTMFGQTEYGEGHTLWKLVEMSDNYDGFFDFDGSLSHSIKVIMGYYDCEAGDIAITKDGHIKIDDVALNLEEIDIHNYAELSESTIGFTTELYLNKAYSKLVGSRKYTDFIDKLWELLRVVNTIDVVRLGGDLSGRVHDNLIPYLLMKSNGFITLNLLKNSILPDKYSVGEKTKQIMILPFVSECLKHIRGERSSLSHYIEMTDFWLPYELVKAYASNLD